MLGSLDDTIAQSIAECKYDPIGMAMIKRQFMDHAVTRPPHVETPFLDTSVARVEPVVPVVTRVVPAARAPIMQDLDFILFQSNSNSSCVLFKQGYVSHVGHLRDEMKTV